MSRRQRLEIIRGIHVRHELNDVELIATEIDKSDLFKMQWQMLHVILNEINKLSLIRFRKRVIFKYEFPL